MTRTPLSVPELAIIGGTRAALGAGAALLLADRLAEPQRRAVGWTLLAVGVVSTIPIAAQLMGSFQDQHRTDRPRAGRLPYRRRPQLERRV